MNNLMGAYLVIIPSSNSIGYTKSLFIGKFLANQVNFEPGNQEPNWIAGR